MSSFDEKALIPSNLNTPEFLRAWEEWKTHRKDKREPICTKLTVEKAMKLLGPLGPEKAIASIDQSIAGGWTGLFDPRGGTRPAPFDPIAELRRQAEQEKQHGQS